MESRFGKRKLNHNGKSLKENSFSHWKISENWGKFSILVIFIQHRKPDSESFSSKNRSWRSSSVFKINLQRVSAYGNHHQRQLETAWNAPNPKPQTQANQNENRKEKKNIRKKKNGMHTLEHSSSCWCVRHSNESVWFPSTQFLLEHEVDNISEHNSWATKKYNSNRNTTQHTTESQSQSKRKSKSKAKGTKNFIRFNSIQTNLSKSFFFAFRSALGFWEEKET